MLRYFADRKDWVGRAEKGRPGPSLFDQESFGVRLPRYEGDDDPSPGNITPRIVASIRDADLIVADLTGLNPNVFYEVAIAHGFNIPTVHIQTVGEKTPFDVKDMRTIFYDLGDPEELEKAQAQLAKAAEYARAHPETLETPLSDAGRFLAVAESDDPVAQSNVITADAIQALSADVRQILDAVVHRDRYDSAPVGDGYGGPDYSRLSMVIDRAKRDSRLTVTDLVGTVGMSTSVGHDQLMRKLTAEVGGWEVESPVIDDIVYDSTMKAAPPPPDFGEPLPF